SALTLTYIPAYIAAWARCVLSFPFSVNKKLPPSCCTWKRGRVSVLVVLVSAHMEPFDLACFQSLDIDPASKKYLILKSRVHWRAGFGNLTTQVFECDGVGLATSDYTKLRFVNVRRPVYPLDDFPADDAPTSGQRSVRI
ncbi:MlrC C-terminal domain-containing protein, partial [Alcaligenaceae bacterium]|nr:MlrC C-terminal domain-containing protein [Alcaligenaceae bacterium]